MAKKKESLDLQLTKVELTNFGERLNKKVADRHSFQETHVSVNKEPFARLIADYLAMEKFIAEKGFSINHALHYNETEEFKNGLDDSNIPTFLKN